jgi:hypothetical protein
MILRKTTSSNNISNTFKLYSKTHEHAKLNTKNTMQTMNKNTHKQKQHTTTNKNYKHYAITKNSILEQNKKYD